MAKLWPKVLSLSLSLVNASILERIKEGYLVWIQITQHLAKGQRYTIGARIESKFLDLLELSYNTYFSAKETKAEKISDCVLVLDTLKFFIYIAWEGKMISHQQYTEIAGKLEEIGKMFGGWRKNLNQIEKKNRNL